MNETWIHAETLYQGKIFSVKVGRARLDNGTESHREVVLHGGGVGIVPVLGDRVVLVRQFRIAVGKEVLELPAGRLEPGEEPRRRAEAELEEETGYRAARLEHVASCYCSPGFTNERDEIYIAYDLEKTQQDLESDEHVEIVEVTADEAARLLDNLEIEDAKTVIGLREWLVRRDRRP